MAKRRKRGDGSIHLRKDGRWEGRIVVGRDAKGLPVTKNVLAKTKAECVAKLEKLREVELISEGELDKITAKNSQSFSPYLARIMP